MQKVSISVEEKLTLNHELTFEVPDHMSEDELNDLLDRIEEELKQDGTFDDLPRLLKRKGYEVLSILEEDRSCSSKANVVITDYTITEEE